METTTKNNQDELDKSVVIRAEVDRNNLFTRREWVLRYASPFKALMFMAGPMIIITIVNALYGIVDKQLTLNFAIENVKSFMDHGKTSYIDIQSSTGINDPNLFARQLINVSTQYSNTIIVLLSALSLLTSVGTSIRWGQAMGKRDKKEMDSILIAGTIQSLVMSGIGVIILYFISPYIICAQANIPFQDRSHSLVFVLADEYVTKFIFGFPLLVIATFLSTLLRTEGKVWWVIIINIAAVGLNIGFGEMFMEHASDDQKMAGAVYGSMVAWGFMIGSALLVISLSKDSLLRPNLKNFVFNTKMMLSIWMIGISPFLSNFIFAIGNFTMTLLITTMHDYSQIYESVINGTSHFNVDIIRIQFFANINGNSTLLSTTYISPAIRVLSSGSPWITLLWAPIIGMMQGGNVNYAYNKGSQKRFKIVEIFRLQLLLTITWGIIVLLLIVSAGGVMLKMFDGPQEYHWWFVAYLCTIIITPITYCSMSVFQGIGKGKNATILAVFRSFICGISLMVLGWFIAHHFSPNGTNDWIIFLFYAMSEIPAALLSIWFIYKVAKKMISQYRVNDKKDDFQAPSYLTASLNEIAIKEAKTIGAINKRLNHRIANETDESTIGAYQVQGEAKIHKILANLNKKRTRNQTKYQFRAYLPTDDKIINRKNELTSKYEAKLANDKMAKDKVEKWKEKQDYRLAKMVTKADLQLSHIEMKKYKISPWLLLVAIIEPQPLNKYNDQIDVIEAN